MARLVSYKAGGSRSGHPSDSQRYRAFRNEPPPPPQHQQQPQQHVAIHQSFERMSVVPLSTASSTFTSTPATVAFARVPNRQHATDGEAATVRPSQLATHSPPPVRRRFARCVRKLCGCCCSGSGSGSGDRSRRKNHPADAAPLRTDRSATVAGNWLLLLCCCCCCRRRPSSSSPLPVAIVSARYRPPDAAPQRTNAGVRTPVAVPSGRPAPVPAPAPVAATPRTKLWHWDDSFRSNADRFLQTLEEDAVSAAATTTAATGDRSLRRGYGGKRTLNLSCLFGGISLACACPARVRV